jgi:hypothetical protein
MTAAKSYFEVTILCFIKLSGVIYIPYFYKSFTYLLNVFYLSNEVPGPLNLDGFKLKP